MVLKKHLYMTFCIVVCALCILGGSFDLVTYQHYHEKIPRISGEQQYMGDDL